MQDRPLIIVLIVLGVIVPGIVAFGIVYVFGFKARYAIKAGEISAMQELRGIKAS